MDDENHVPERLTNSASLSEPSDRSVISPAVDSFTGGTSTIDLNNSTFPGSSDFDAVETDPSSSDKIAEWDFQLPRLRFAASTQNAANIDQGSSTFDPAAFARAVQDGANLLSLIGYLDRYSREKVSYQINDEIEGFPLMFYIVESNNERLLRHCVSKSGNPEAVHVPSQIPLLVFAIVNSHNVEGDKTLLVATLLSLGASPNVLPSAFYTPYLQDLPETGPENSANSEIEGARFNTPWCTEDVSQRLASALTLSQRYFIQKAANLRVPTAREVDLAQRRNAEGLLGISYFLIGQSLASHLLLRKLLSHILSPSKRPLVMVFAGPSGHGKTELARRLGHLLSLELEVVDCTAFSREIELFGPREPYSGAAQGSPLNNFLAKNAGKRCIVFLDEFEKTTTEIHKTLLLPFDNGEYQDRRHRSNINCSNTIWILATNAHDEVIQDYFESHQEALSDPTNQDEGVRLIKKLASEVKEDFLRTFGPPLTGRISAFIPFLPFSVGEQAVIVHKYLLELGESVEGPVNLSTGPKEKLLGNVRLRIRRDGSVCRILAESGYNIHLGARSLITAVDTVKSRLVDEYLEINEGFSEHPEKTECFVDVQADEIVVTMSASK
ncbi:P-loop containing nucleoside triphosphate hydrolase protein [Microthyrium microscopicum]|uniref:P-loop containing nucleoside triphosphate hydrolase protein n=1 Tax=Microthyrium microscopicum TaxID=703497 RepID=A0A6A6UD96_9PEZI|nr:P-loop containing nucleoside triphosphate hydrolase protein [Microthyrium microscopicum]